MQPSDWPAVRAIYEQGLATRQATFETEAPSWEEWDAGHLAELRLVAERDGEVIGWTALSPTSRRDCYAGVAEAPQAVRLQDRRYTRADREAGRRLARHGAAGATRFGGVGSSTARAERAASVPRPVDSPRPLP